LRLYKNIEEWRRLLAIFAKAGLPESGLGRAADVKTYVYVFNEGSSNISIIDTKTQKVRATIDAGLRIRWFSNRFFDGKRVWTVDADFENAQVIVFDPWTLQTLKRIPFGKGPSMSVELSPDLKFAVAISPGTNEVVVIDTATYKIVRRILVGKFPCDLTISVDGTTAFIVEREEDTLSALDWRAGKTLKTIALEKGSRPHMLTLSPDSKRLWVQERDVARLSVYDAKTLERVARIPVGRVPVTTEFTAPGHFSITTHMGENFVKVFDSATLKEVRTIPVGRSPVNAIFDAGGRYAYVANRQSNTVSVIDVERWEVVKTIQVGKHPFGIYLFAPGRGKMSGNRKSQLQYGRPKS
jgi:YVTN family beta-propeller protein